MKHTHLIATAAFTLALGASRGTALAQCSSFRDARFTGDDSTAAAFTLTDSKEQSLVDAFGIERYDEEIDADGMNFNDEPGGLSTSDRNGSYRRLLNALLMMGSINRGSESYQSWAASHICTIEPTTECGINGETTFGLGGTCHVNITRNSLRNNNVLVRASTVAHEARHHVAGHLHGPFNVSDWEYDDSAVCEAGASCDMSWSSGDGGSDYGAQREQIEFIERASAQSSLFTPMVLAEARELANSKLNRSFKYHPGFNFDGASSFYRRGWSAQGTVGDGPDIEVAYMPDPLMPTRAVTGFGLRMRSDSTQGSRITTMRIYTRAVYDDGSLGGTSTRTVGSEENMGLERVRELPSGRVATGFVVRADAPGSSDANITTLGLYGHTLDGDGPTGTRDFYWADNSDQDHIEINRVLPDGTFLTGLGFASRNANVTRWAYTHTARSPWTPYVGDNAEPMYNLACPSGQVAIGTVQNFSPTGNYVGYFGLVCGSRAVVESGVMPAESARYVLHSSFDGVTMLHARRESWSQFMAARPTGPGDANRNSVSLCGAGYALRAVTVRAGDRIDQVVRDRCVRLHDVSAVGTINNNTQVDVGGDGGTEIRTDCADGHVVDGLFLRSHGYVRGFALRCE